MSDSGISKEDLKAILASNMEMVKELVTELKKPTVVEQKAIDQAQKELDAKNEQRAKNAEGTKRQIEEKRTTQKWCSHKHPAAHGGHSHGVLVSEAGNPNGYILCQLCQVKVRPEPAPANYHGLDIYDTRLFNIMVQDLPSNALFQ